MTKAVLAINAGSSSIKFGLFDVAGAGDPVLLSKGTLEDVGSDPCLRASDASGSAHRTIPLPAGSARDGIFRALFEWIDDELGGGTLIAVGHRIVHGGAAFDQPIVIDAAVLASIEALTPLAPLHQSRCLEPIRAIQALRPDVVHVACFDTAFHRTLSPLVSRYAIPRRYEAQGIRKYGFHGLSYEFVAGKLKTVSPQLATGRVVVAHLGNGASLCAMRDGTSQDTTMGFSALDGLVMGTRCGALDPGIILYLQKTQGLSADEVEDILYHRSGLIGVAEVTGDMRALLESADYRAQEALELFAFRAARETAAMANTLAGIDCLVFTGGIGENSPKIRVAICERLRWLDVELDPEKNDQAIQCISYAKSRVKVFVIPTDEELVIARHVAAQINDVGREAVRSVRAKHEAPQPDS